MNKKIIIFSLLFIVLIFLVFSFNNEEDLSEKETYIDNNIVQIAHEKGFEEVLGGTFFVTKIEWKDDNTAIIEFEDGHNLFTIEYSFNPLKRIEEWFYDYQR